MPTSPDQGASELVLDIGGEGRYPEAWNLNPSRVRTVGSQRGQPIPKHIPGRADAIPLPDASVAKLIVERTPLLIPALREICRVIAPGGTIVLRHAQTPVRDPHEIARQVLPGRARQRIVRLAGRIVQETEFCV